MNSCVIFYFHKYCELFQTTNSRARDKKMQSNWYTNAHQLSKNAAAISNGMVPIDEYEKLRRRVRTTAIEMYQVLSNELLEIQKRTQPLAPELGQHIDKILTTAIEHKNSLIGDIDVLRRIDGYEQWRRIEANNLSDLVQSRIKHLQNPADCSKARKLVCYIPVKLFLCMR